LRLQYASFSLPLHASSTEQEELNRFLRGHRVVQSRRELASVDGAPCWAILVEYLEGPGKLPGGEHQAKSKVDYREILSEADFSLYSKLRDARKKLADEAGLPVYAVCTNEQLAEIAKGKPKTLADFLKIEGLGKGKAEKYATALLECVNGGSGESPPF